jgi:hypothetical protein
VVNILAVYKEIVKGFPVLKFCKAELLCALFTKLICDTGKYNKFTITVQNNKQLLTSSVLNALWVNVGC